MSTDNLKTNHEENFEVNLENHEDTIPDEYGMECIVSWNGWCTHNKKEYTFNFNNFVIEDIGTITGHGEDETGTFTTTGRLGWYYNKKTKKNLPRVFFDKNYSTRISNACKCQGFLDNGTIKGTYNYGENICFGDFEMTTSDPAWFEIERKFNKELDEQLKVKEDAQEREMHIKQEEMDAKLIAEKKEWLTKHFGQFLPGIYDTYKERCEEVRKERCEEVRKESCHLLVDCENHSLGIWSYEQKKMIYKNNIKSDNKIHVENVAFLPEKRRFFVSTHNEGLYQFDINYKKCIEFLKDKEIGRIATSQNGKFLVVFSNWQKSETNHIQHDEHPIPPFFGNYIPPLTVQEAPPPQGLQVAPPPPRLLGAPLLPPPRPPGAHPPPQPPQGLQFAPPPPRLLGAPPPPPVGILGVHPPFQPPGLKKKLYILCTRTQKYIKAITLGIATQVLFLECSNDGDYIFIRHNANHVIIDNHNPVNDMHILDMKRSGRIIKTFHAKYCKQLSKDKQAAIVENEHGEILQLHWKKNAFQDSDFQFIKNYGKLFHSGLPCLITLSKSEQNIIGACGQVIRVLNLPSSNEIQKFKFGSYVKSMSLIEDGKKLLIAQQNLNLVVIDLNLMDIIETSNEITHEKDVKVKKIITIIS